MGDGRLASRPYRRGGVGTLHVTRFFVAGPPQNDIWVEGEEVKGGSLTLILAQSIISVKSTREADAND